MAATVVRDSGEWPGGKWESERELRALDERKNEGRKEEERLRTSSSFHQSHQPVWCDCVALPALA
jgi:hypothetical protein